MTVSREVFNKRLPQFGTITANNVEDISQARVIGIGVYDQNHFLENKEEKKKDEELYINSAAAASSIIYNTLKRRDIFLMEGLSQRRWPWLLGKLFNPGLPLGVKVYGWDQPRRIRKEQFKRAFQLGNDPRMADIDTGQDANLNPVGWIEGVRRRAHEIGFTEFTSLYDELVDGRNESLVAFVNKLRRKNPNSRILFTAGGGHLSEQLAQQIGKDNQFMFIQTKIQ